MQYQKKGFASPNPKAPFAIATSSQRRLALYQNNEISSRTYQSHLQSIHFIDMFIYVGVSPTFCSFSFYSSPAHTISSTCILNLSKSPSLLQFTTDWPQILSRNRTSRSELYQGFSNFPAELPWTQLWSLSMTALTPLTQIIHQHPLQN